MFRKSKQKKINNYMAKVIKKETKKPTVKVAKPVVKKEKSAKNEKPVVKVAAVKVVKKEAIKSVARAKNESTLTVTVYGLDGKSAGKMTLPGEIFGETVNKKLLAQAVRVYLANKRQGNASTKTRGEVDGSTRKIYRQKGTGRARHGSVRAPIFVKGGIVHGPKPRDFSLELPKKMKRKALFSALSAKLMDDEIRVLAGFEKLTPKTKNFSGVLKHLTIGDKVQKLLLVTPDGFENVKRAARNIPGISSTSAKRLNALDVLKNKYLLLAKESILELEDNFLKK
jgi:large subunit ribosomal protein L4